jgi:chromosome segregation ATPase
MQHEAHWMTEQKQHQQPPPYPYGTLGGPEDSSFAWHLQHDLDESLRREQELLAQLRNITASADAMEQRERLHLQTLDVLTERVMEVESEAARQRNELLEYRVNCTQLAEQVGVSEGEVEEWKTKCLEWMERHEEDEEKMDNLRKKLKMSSRRAEDLAAMIERHRLDQKKGESYRKRDEKKRGGFWSWLFGLGSIEDEDVDDYDGMYEAGRSTLLEALHTERDSVGELESMVAILQQNNSAVAEQVKSRDVIIEELNDRIAVFEEDKVVLKAALKQLQKEMSEEAPKTAKLLEDLANAKKEVEHLSVEIESLVETHQKEIAALQQAISQKQETIQATESNLTVIATYVDKLEERLADFTVARRDIEIREERCLQIERNASKAERQKNSLKKRVEELEAEHEELKKLLEELVQERTTLLKERDRLIAQRSAIEQDEQSLREAQARLSEEAEGLIKDRDQLKAQVDQMKKELNEASATNVQLMEQLDQSKTESFRLKDEVEGLSVARKELQGTLQQTESARNKLRAQVARLEADLAEKEKECVKLTTEKALNIETKNATEPEVSMKKTTASEPLLPPKDDSIIANASMAKAPLGPLQRVETPSISEQKVSFAGAQRPAAPVIRPPPPGLPPVQREAKTTAQKLPTTSEGSGPLVLIKKPLPRRVPLRKIRKFFAKATGIHGFFSKKGKEPEPFVTYKGQKPSASTKGPLFPRNSASELRAAKQPPMSKRPT